MKTLITLILFSFISLGASAQSLEAKPFQDLLNDIQEANLTYKGTGKVFGYISTQSCLYVSEDIAIFKNYCYPVRNYPARGYTIISAKYGMIDLYEEKLPNILKRDIQITQFPAIIKPYLTTPLPQQTVDGLSAMMEKMHFNYFPGCWSTNFSFYTETHDVNCSVSTDYVQGFEAWGQDTQTILLDEQSWLELVKAIDGKLTPSL